MGVGPPTSRTRGERIDELMRGCQSESFSTRAATRQELNELLAENERLREALRVVDTHAVFLTYDPTKTDAQNDALQRAYARVREALNVLAPNSESETTK